MNSLTMITEDTSEKQETKLHNHFFIFPKCLAENVKAIEVYTFCSANLLLIIININVQITAEK